MTEPTLTTAPPEWAMKLAREAFHIDAYGHLIIADLALAFVKVRREALEEAEG